MDTKNEMSAEGKPVFTRHELDKLKKAIASMKPEERTKAAIAAIEVKEIFGGYISQAESYEA